MRSHPDLPEGYRLVATIAYGHRILSSGTRTIVQSIKNRIIIFAFIDFYDLMAKQWRDQIRLNFLLGYAD